jgi:aconitate hydratase
MPPAELRDGSVVIAAITSCTNTSNPSVMIGAGLLARNAVRRGLERRPWVKTSLAPGSKVVTEYLKAAHVMAPLEALGFYLVGYGCTTCIGNSGPLSDDVAREVQERQLVVAAVLSGNRNFEARIHSLVRANYLASPLLVVAYALAGRIDIDFEREPIGTDQAGNAVFLRELWPPPEEIAEAVASALRPELFSSQYASVFEGDERWRALPLARGEGGRFGWDPASTYVAVPPYFDGMRREPDALRAVTGARALLWLGDSVTTDHISPAGAMPVDGPAGRWLRARGVELSAFNTLGSRRGHHEVMMRGTFGNVRIRNRLVPEREGNWSVHLPSGEVASVYEVAMRYQAERTPLVVLAGKGREARGTGPPRERRCSGSVPSSPRASSASIAVTSWAWASCRSSCPPARAPSRSASTAASTSTCTASAMPSSAPAARPAWWPGGTGVGWSRSPCG